MHVSLLSGSAVIESIFFNEEPLPWLYSIRPKQGFVSFESAVVNEI
jgi:hypothetical protein